MMLSAVPAALIGAVIVAISANLFAIFRQWRIDDLAHIGPTQHPAQRPVPEPAHSAPRTPKTTKPTKASARLEAAGIDKQPAELAFIVAIAAVICGFAALLITGAPWGLLAALIPFVATAVIVRSKTTSRRKRFAEQMGAILPSVAEMMRSGLSFEQALRSVSEHAPDPLRGECRRAVREMDFSGSAADSVQRMADRTDMRDLHLLSTACRIHQQLGGNLAGTVDNVAETIASKQDMRRFADIESSAAKGSIKAIVFIEALLFALMLAANETYQQFYLVQGPGWIVLAVIAGLEIAGILIMVRMTSFEME